MASPAVDALIAEALLYTSIFEAVMDVREQLQKKRVADETTHPELGFVQRGQHRSLPLSW